MLKYVLIFQQDKQRNTSSLSLVTPSPHGTIVKITEDQYKAYIILKTTFNLTICIILYMWKYILIFQQAKQRNTPSLPSVTPSPNGSIVNLTVENRPQPPSYTASMQHQRQQQQQLLQNRNDTENVDVLRTEILVLKQQVIEIELAIFIKCSW